MSGFLYFLRLCVAWFALLLAVTLVYSAAFNGKSPGWIVFLWLVCMVFVTGSAISQVRRVRLTTGKVDADSLANRQRRVIEMPLGPAQAFRMLDATIRELPRVEEVETAQDSLQVRAKVRRIDTRGKRASFLTGLLSWLGTPRNQIFATLTPHGSTGTVNLVCEPESRAWLDWFTADGATNLENAEAITRAISRRIGEVRRGEEASTLETATEKELAVAKLRLLHAQVEPHFLYNTLGSAKYLVRSDPVRAEAIIDNLILYLRHSLPSVEDALSTLGAEVERARAYLDIMRIRMGDRLAISIHVPEPLLATPFPTMMLQTLVENAIKHGLEPKPGGGMIWVLAVDKGDHVSVTVADDGIGLASLASGADTTPSTAGQPGRPAGDVGGVGLRNVHERLRLAYGKAASLDLAANFPAGAAATITLPKRREGGPS